MVFFISCSITNNPTDTFLFSPAMPFTRKNMPVSKKSQKHTNVSKGKKSKNRRKVAAKIAAALATLLAAGLISAATYKKYQRKQQENKNAATKIQTAFRGRHAKNKTMRRRESVAATKMQTVVRGRQAKNKTMRRQTERLQREGIAEMDAVEAERELEETLLAEANREVEMANRDLGLARNRKASNEEELELLARVANAEDKLGRRQLKCNQIQEYEESLRTDRKKKFSKRAITIQTAYRGWQLRHAAKKKEATRLTLERSIPSEPESGHGTITLKFKLPSEGGTLQRRFKIESKLQLVFDFLDSRKSLSRISWTLERRYPKRIFTETDGHESLENLGITSQETLIVKQNDD